MFMQFDTTGDESGSINLPNLKAGYARIVGGGISWYITRFGTEVARGRENSVAAAQEKILRNLNGARPVKRKARPGRK